MIAVALVIPAMELMMLVLCLLSGENEIVEMEAIIFDICSTIVDRPSFIVLLLKEK